MSRPPKAAVLRLLEMDNQEVQLRTDELIEDVDGFPAGVSSEFDRGILSVDLDLLGWTQAELDDSNITA